MNFRIFRMRNPWTQLLWHNQDFKNWIKGKTVSTSDSQFNLVFDRFWTFLPNQTGIRFSVELVGSIWFLKQ